MAPTNKPIDPPAAAAPAKTTTVPTKAAPVDAPTPPAIAARRPHVRVEQAPNPPAQPAMIPAKQIYGATGDAPVPRPRPPAAGGPRVVALKLGYYADKLQRVGDVFSLTDPKDFSESWMDYVDPTTPERTTGSNAALRREHDAIVAGAPRMDGIVTGRDDVPDSVPTGTQNPLGSTFE